MEWLEAAWAGDAGRAWREVIAVKVKGAASLARDAAKQFSGDRASTMAAALSYHAILSLPALAATVIAILGIVFGRQAVERQIATQLGRVLSPEGAQTVESIIRNTMDHPSSNVVAVVIAPAVLVIGAMGLFSQLQQSLNTVWKVAPKAGRGIWGMLRDRLPSFAMIGVVVVILGASVVVSSGINAFGKFAPILGHNAAVMQLLNFLLFFVLTSIAFMLTLKYLPDAVIGWHDVWLGGLLTGLLFTIGQFLLSLYLGLTHVASTYGAAGGVILIMLWVYYSSMVFLFGAEFTAAYARQVGGPPSGRLISREWLGRQSRPPWRPPKAA